MTQVAGFGPKKARVVWQELGVESLGALKEACENGKLSQLKGFGAKTCANILEGIIRLERDAGRFLLSHASRAAEPILAALRALPSVERVEAAGSLRRFKETVHDLDFVAATAKPEEVMQAFVSLEGVAEVVARGETKTTVRLGRGLQADLRTVSPEQFPHALQHFTGSKEHNVALRGRAKKMGLKINEYGLFREKPGGQEELILCADEAAIYKELGLAWIEPETRENVGEIEAAEKGPLPRLVERGDLRGMLHCHTNRSDGKNTLREMAEASREMGFEYFGVCDHSHSLQVARGVPPAEVRQQWEEADLLNAEYEANKINFRVLKGIEADILPDGSLDYFDQGDLLEGFDFVVGSVHARFNLTQKEQTARVLRAFENPVLTILGHPTGRLLLRRDGIELDMEAILEAAAAKGVVVEINASPQRLDLDWRWGRKARELGVKVAINPDAHSVAGLQDIRWGVGIARKGGFQAKDVVNCLSAKDFLALAAKRRK
jgi:DNA polymerase (family 10)